MPKQILTIEVSYTRYMDVDASEEQKEGFNPDEHSLRPDPADWPWESMADGYMEDEEEGNPYYTRNVEVLQAGPVVPDAWEKLK